MSFEAKHRAAWTLMPCTFAIFATACASSPRSPASANVASEATVESAKSESTRNETAKVDAKTAPAPTRPTRTKIAVPPKPEQCELAARGRLQAGDRDGAFALLARCSEMESYFDLAPLMREPWKSELRTRGEDAIRVLARIVSRGGDNMAVDLLMLREEGFDLWPIKGAEKEPESYRRRYVVVRGRLEWRDEGEKKVLFVEELVPRKNDDVYLSGRYGHVYVQREYRQGWSFQPSGREVRVTGAPSGCEAGKKELLVVLTHIDDFEPTTDEVSPDAGQETLFRGRGRLLDCRVDNVTTTEGRDDGRFGR